MRKCKRKIEKNICVNGEAGTHPFVSCGIKERMVELLLKYDEMVTWLSTFVSL